LFKKKDLQGTYFDMLTGDILDTIGEYLESSHPISARSGEPPMEFPNMNKLLLPFNLVCRQILLKTTSYKQECLSIQMEMLEDQVVDLKREIFEYFD
jgi:hypothetical protein